MGNIYLYNQELLKKTRKKKQNNFPFVLACQSASLSNPHTLNSFICPWLLLYMYFDCGKELHCRIIHGHFVVNVTSEVF